MSRGSKKGQLNNGLLERQEELRNKTMNDIESAIISFKEEGYQNITIEMLMNVTGYSRTTFAKEHVQAILKKHNLGKYRIIINLPSKDEEKMKFLEKELYKAKSEILKIREELILEKEKNKKLNKLLKESNTEIQYLNQDIYELSKKLELDSIK